MLFLLNPVSERNLFCMSLSFFRAASFFERLLNDSGQAFSVLAGVEGLFF